MVVESGGKGLADAKATADHTAIESVKLAGAGAAAF